jgi:hypothetical protein
VFVAVVLAASVGLGVLIATALASSQAASQAASTAAAQANPIAELQALARKDPAAALAQAYSFESGHPGEPEAALLRYEALAAVVPAGSSVEADVATSRGRARRALEYLAAQAFEDLRVEVRDLVDQSGKTAEALAKLDAFPARFQGTPAWAQHDELRREIAGTRR